MAALNNIGTVDHAPSIETSKVVRQAGTTLGTVPGDHA
jgi:hypothetical protein